MTDQCETVKLDYNIHKCSSYSGSCWPENILVDNTKNQKSRWFTDSNQPDQFLMLKLYTPSIVETITFGKYFKAHVSDLKKFQVYGGLDEQNLSLLLNGGLKNDNTSEVFRLRHHTTDGFYLPVLYLKVVPLQSWGPPHNFTIWHIALAGKKDDEFIRKCIESINLRKEEEAVRVVLKHLRRRRYKDAFEALSRESGVQLEGPIQERLWNALVENGDFEEAERIFEDAVADGALEWYLSWQKYSPHWRQLSMCSAPEEKWVPYAPVSPPPSNDPPCADREWIKSSNDKELFDDVPADACACKPGPRGGHQLVLDSVNNTLYLYGGWDGSQDLSDLWSYDIEAERWSLRCEHSGLAGGPSPRSCHKMVLLPQNHKLYTLGRYLDTAKRQPQNMKSDFYTYDTTTDEWSLLMEDTRVAGGPGLLYDHQMCIDTEDQIIFVFGGRLLLPTSEDSSRVRYSGLFAYYIRTNTWKEINLEAEGANGPLPRMGHSMLYHPSQHRLYVFAGQRNKDVLLGLWYWDVRGGAGGAVSGTASTTVPGNAACTQRATLDAHTDEIVVLSGNTKEKDKHVFNTLWVFSLQRLTWACIYRNESSSPDDPRPRFAHQFVYDPTRRIHYLFGGNPGNPLNSRLRLDDLWSLTLSKPSVSVVTNRVRSLLREARFRQLAADDDPARAVEALYYLRGSVGETVDHSDPKQRQHFHSLPAALFMRPEPAPPAPRALTPRRPRHRLAPRARPRAALVPPAILGAEDSIPENPQPFEDFNESWCPGCAECESCAPSAGSPADHQRNTRIEIFDNLCQYFRPSTIHPSTNVTNLVNL